MNLVSWLRTAWVCALLLVLTAALAAQTQKTEQKYDYDDEDVRKALDDLKVNEPVRLPTLTGFVSDNVRVAEFARPYAQYEVEVIPKDEHTDVRVRATITAWHTDPRTGAQQYESLSSSGRLEADLIDRIAEQLKKSAGEPNVKAAKLEKRLAEVHAQRVALEQRREQLRAELQRTDTTTAPQSGEPKLVTVKSAGIPVVAAPSKAARILLKAQGEDAFEIVGNAGAWLAVKLASGKTGYIPRSQTAPLSTRATETRTGSEFDSDFAIARENVTVFLGNWATLKGKKALFVFVRPLGKTSEVGLREKKLNYAKYLFADRLKQAVHSVEPFAGVVVIFVGGNGGIAAATLDNIRRWQSGMLPEDAFLKHCSLDPPDAFHATGAAGEVASSQ